VQCCVQVFRQACALQERELAHRVRVLWRTREPTRSSSGGRIDCPGVRKPVQTPAADARHRAATRFTGDAPVRSGTRSRNAPPSQPNRLPAHPQPSSSSFLRLALLQALILYLLPLLSTVLFNCTVLSLLFTRAAVSTLLGRLTSKRLHATSRFSTPSVATVNHYLTTQLLRFNSTCSRLLSLCSRYHGYVYTHALC
jgi:hypothetical protein